MQEENNFSNVRLFFFLDLNPFPFLHTTCYQSYISYTLTTNNKSIDLYGNVYVIADIDLKNHSRFGFHSLLREKNE